MAMVVLKREPDGDGCTDDRARWRWLYSRESLNAMVVLTREPDGDASQYDAHDDQHDNE